MGRQCAIGRATCLTAPVFVVTVRRGEPDRGEFVDHFACTRHLAYLILYTTLPGQSAVVGRLDG